MLTLALLKLRGTFRRQVRKTKSLSGALFMIVGLLLMVAWFGSIAMGSMFDQRRRALDPELLVPVVQFALGFLAVVSLGSATAVKGLYLPKGEIEALFSAPVSRADLVRYRMQVDLARTVLGAVVLGLVGFRHMPRPLFGFVGVFLAMMTMGVVRQAASLAIGDAGSRLGAFFRRRKMALPRLMLGLAVAAVVMAMTASGRALERLTGVGDLESLARSVLLHPAVQVVLLPCRPWAETIAATDTASFLGWAGLCLLLWALLFELTARMPVDYRELSMETSYDIARRIRGFRRGGFFGGGSVSSGAATKRVPWLFGRGPFGAAAWIRLGSILRKSRGTIVVAMFVVGIVTFVASMIVHEAEDPGTEALAGSLIIGLVGVLYLAGGMRFDFRSDLDRMETIKCWPLSGAKLFFATLLPEVLLVSSVLVVAIVGRLLVLRAWHPALPAVLLGIPPVALAWTAVDNAVFLIAPVRFVPGQEGTLHHTGRAMVLFFLRFLMFAVVAALVGACVALIWWIGKTWLGLSDRALFLVSAATGAAALLVLDLLLVRAGGWALRRFDVARDRG